MKKTILAIFLSVVIIGIAFLWQHTSLLNFEKDVIYVAIVGPMSGPEKESGQEMIKGAELYLDYINEIRGFHEKKIKLLIFDDKSDQYSAKKIAGEIASQRQALIVLGHGDSATSIAAGDIYKRNEICAITACSLEETDTFENDWYFRITPNIGSQINFVTHYIRKTLKKTSVNIIFDKNSFAITVDIFEKMAKKIGIHIEKSWGFDPLEENIDKILKDIANEAVAWPGIIFFAMQPQEAAKLIPLLKDSGGNHMIIGTDTLSKPSFINALKKYPKEKLKQGYYSDGILALCPLIPEVADKEAYFVRQYYIKKYKQEPTALVGCYFDAMRVAVKAFQKAEVHGKGYVLSDRRNIKKALGSFYNYRNAIRGISGRIYFTTKGNVFKPPFIGFYEKQKLLPDFIQYQLIPEYDQTKDIFKKYLDGNIIPNNGEIMTQTRVVYTGIHINEISNLNLMDSSYTADFYIWFRYKGEFDDSQIEFLNVVENTELGKPFKENIDKEGITLRVYHVQASFKENFTFNDYPFDKHTLYIKFRHHKLKKEQLIYVEDKLDVYKAPYLFKQSTIKGMNDWKLGNIIYFQDTLEKVSTMGNPKFFNNNYIISFSSFTAATPIERKNIVSSLKMYLPIGIIMLLIFVILYAVPTKYSYISISELAILLIINMTLHLKLVSEFPILYISSLEYIYLSNYIILIISCLIVLLHYNSSKTNNNNKLKKNFIRLGYFINMVIILIVSYIQIKAYMG